MAVFGAPVAHEDDPERAVRAALAVRDWARDAREVEVRIAVNTGEALVALAARPELGEAMVAGDVVNTAARLQSAAPENGVLVGETTYRATREAIDYRELAACRSQGQVGTACGLGGAAGSCARPGRAHGPDAARRPRPGARRPCVHALERTPGRAARRSWSRSSACRASARAASSSSSFRLLDDGSGARLLAAGSLAALRRGRQLLGARRDGQGGGRHPRDGRRGARSRAARGCGRPASSQTRPTRGGWRVICGRWWGWMRIGTDRATRRGEAFAAWRRFLEALAERRPLVLVFEDLHCADDGLLDFVDYLAEWAGRPCRSWSSARHARSCSSAGPAGAAAR